MILRRGGYPHGALLHPPTRFRIKPTGGKNQNGIRSSTAALRLLCSGTVHRHPDDAPASRQASSGLRQQPQRRRRKSSRAEGAERRRPDQEPGERARSHPHRRPQQRRRPREPQHVLGHHGTERGGDPSGAIADAIKRPSATSPASRKNSTMPASSSLAADGPGWSRRRRQAADHEHAQPGQPLSQGFSRSWATTSGSTPTT